MFKLETPPKHKNSHARSSVFWGEEIVSINVKMWASIMPLKNCTESVKREKMKSFNNKITSDVTVPFSRPPRKIPNCPSYTRPKDYFAKPY